MTDERRVTPAVVPAGAVLAVAFLALLGLNLVLARDSPGPILYDDGAAYLAQARYFAGQPHPDLTHTASYQPGYPLVLVPAHLLSDDPATQHRLVLLTNALLAAGLVLPLWALARRPLGLAPLPAVAVAAVGAAHPSVVLQSGFEWAESLLAVATAGWLVLAHRALTRPSAWCAVALGAGAAGLYLVHQRLVVALPVAVGVMAVPALRRRVGPVAVAAGVGTLVLGVLAGRVLTALVRSRLWSQPRPSREGYVLDLALDPSAWPSAALNATGQVWYLAVTSLGLAVVGVMALVTLGIRRGPWASPRPHGAAPAAPPPAPERSDADRLWAVAVLALVGLNLVLSALFLARGDRVDHLVYGRYNETLLPVLLVAGLALVLRIGRGADWRWRAAPLACALAAGAGAAVAIRAGHGVDAFTGHVMPLNVLGLLPFHRSHGMVPTGEITLLALGVTVVVLGTSLLAPRAALALLAVAFVAGGFVAESRTLRPFVEFWAASVTLHEDVARLTEPGDQVAFDWQAFDLMAFNAYQLWLPRRPLVLFDSEVEGPPAPVVIAGPDWQSPRPRPARRVSVETDLFDLAVFEVAPARRP